MKKLITKLSLAGLLAISYAQSALAVAAIDQGAADANSKAGLPTDLFGSGSLFGKIANTLIFLVGAIGVIMMIIGGLRYVISQGDSAQVKQAKDTLLYGIIGIIVAILAYAIVAFISNTIAPTPAPAHTP